MAEPRWFPERMTAGCEWKKKIKWPKSWLPQLEGWGRLWVEQVPQVWGREDQQLVPSLRRSMQIPRWRDHVGTCEFCSSGEPSPRRSAFVNCPYIESKVLWGVSVDREEGKEEPGREWKTVRETGRNARKWDVMKAKWTMSIKDEITRVKCCCKTGLDEVRKPATDWVWRSLGDSQEHSLITITYQIITLFYQFLPNLSNPFIKLP